MAKKNKPDQRTPSRQGVSKPESFTHGMVSDLDPHFQLEGSYSDAQNIRLTNAEGDTFTVENINGNSLFIDLFALNSQSKLDAYTASSAGMLETRTDIPLLGAAPLHTDLFSEIYCDPNNNAVSISHLCSTNFSRQTLDHSLESYFRDVALAVLDIAIEVFQI